jgi:hypothetical protein
MIRHILLFSFRTTLDDTVRASILEELAAFPARFPKMQKFQIGLNKSNRDTTFEHAMTMEFERQTDLDAYLESVFHETFVVEKFKPSIAQRVIATIEV